MRVQNAKDSFYKVLRDRLAVINPDRTTVVRGVTRPAVLVLENEATNVQTKEDCFHLRWAEAETAMQGEYMLVSQRCELVYSTAGTTWNGGLDRGRVLAAMDAELMQAVQLYPQNAVKRVFRATAQDETATMMASRIWWSDVSLGSIRAEAERVSRTATVEVMSFEEGREP